MISPDAGSQGACHAARHALILPAEGPVVALLPGSRQSELRALGGRFVAVARLLAASRPGIRFVVPLASTETEAIWRAIQLAEGGTDLPVTLIPRGTHQALAACDVALVASGTATLETALFRRPMVIAYNMAAISWMLMRRMKYQPYVGLPNILCGEFVVPEFLQDDASPLNLAQAVGNLLDSPSIRERVAGRFAALHQQLRQDNARRAAEAVETLLRA